MPLDFSAELFGSSKKVASFDDALKAEGVAGQLADIARSIYRQESGSGSNTKTSNAGAVGGMQVIPATFSRVADKGWDINNPEHNLRAGIRYLKLLEPMAGGKPELIAAGYYGGEGAIPLAQQGKALRDPLNPGAPDTLQYGAQVASRIPARGKESSARDFSADLFGDAPVASSFQNTEPTISDRAIRTAGLGARAVGPIAAGALAGGGAGAFLGGVGAVPGALAGAGAMGLVQLLDRVSGANNVDRIMDRLGLPAPQNSTERVTQDILGGMAGAGSGMGLGSVMAQSRGPVMQRVGEILQSQPGLQVAGGATGGATAGLTREGGGGTVAQTVAGLAGSVAPAIAATGVPSAIKGLFRGGEHGRQTVADNIKLFEDSGYGMPTAGQASESRLSRATESGLSRAPGSAGRMAAAAQQGNENLGATVNGIAENLAPGATSTKAGATIESGIKDFVKRFKGEQSFLYDKIDSHIPPSTMVKVDNAKVALSELNADIPGAPSLSKFFKNAKIQGIQGALKSDARINDPMQFFAQEVDGKIPYEALKKLRTLVGNEIENNSLVSDVPRSKWKALYGALSEDLGAAAKNAGPDAEKAFARANTFTRAGHERISTYLDRVTGKDTVEQVFRAATSPGEIREGASTINAVMRSILPDDRKMVKAAFIKRLGVANPSVQDAAGEAFSTQTFLTNWSKISPEAKMTLFSGNDGELVKSLNKIARVSGNIRDGSKVFANPSGTAGASANTAAGYGLLFSALTGNVPGIAAIGGTMLGANQSARLMTNHDFVRWLSKSTATPVSAIPSALNELSHISQKMKGEDKAAVDEYLNSAKQLNKQY